MTRSQVELNSNKKELHSNANRPLTDSLCFIVNKFAWGGGQGPVPGGEESPRGQTDTTENITFATPLVEGNKGNLHTQRSYTIRHSSDLTDIKS